MVKTGLEQNMTSFWDPSFVHAPNEQAWTELSARMVHLAYKQIRISNILGIDIQWNLG